MTAARAKTGFLAWCAKHAAVVTPLTTFVGVLAALTLSSGFLFSTPQSQFAELRHANSAVLDSLSVLRQGMRFRYDSVDRAVNDVKLVLGAMSIKLCLDATPRESALMRLNCPAIIAGASATAAKAAKAAKPHSTP